jgi:hypothetical protein
VGKKKKPPPTLRQSVRSEIRRWMALTGLSFSQVVKVLYEK